MTDFVAALQAATEAQLSDLNTCCPAVVVSYDAGRNRAVVKPSLPKALADGRSLDAPAIHEVPILWPAAGGAVITLPLKAGDPVWLQFAQRSLEGWLSGRNDAPDDPRRFDISDAVAWPVMKATGIGSDPDAVVVSFSGSVLRLEPGGTTRLTTTKLVVAGDVEVQGKVDATGDVKAGTISLQTHKHLGVQTGAGVTGLPTP